MISVFPKRHPERAMPARFSVDPTVQQMMPKAG